MTEQMKTIPKLLKYRTSQTPDDIAFKTHSGQAWKGITWAGVYTRARALAAALVNAGLEPGDVIGIILPNSLEWELVQHGGFMAGGVVAGLDINDPLDRIKSHLAQLRPRALAVWSTGILAELPPDLLASVKVILIVESDGPGSELCLKKNIPIYTIRTLTAAPRNFKLPGIKGCQPAIRIFTSGTTGSPKPITFTHGQLIFAASTISDRLRPFLPIQARSACWLPLSSPFQRMVNYCSLMINFTTFMVSNPKDIITLAPEIRPHFLAGVPRFYEKLHEEINRKISRMPEMIQWGIAKGERACLTYRKKKQMGLPVSPGLTALAYVSDALIFRQIRRTMGGCIRFVISGSAPLNQVIPNSFLAWGWLLLESYGVSENILPMTMNTPDCYSFGTVGRPLPGNTIRIDQDGEILVRGKGVAAAGFSRPGDRYLKTGDIGRLNGKGYLCLEGRKSDVFKLSTGRKICPQSMEAALKTIAGVEYGVIYGAGKKFTVALMNIPDDVWKSRVRNAKTELLARQHLTWEIRQICSTMPSYALPVAVAIVHNAFTVSTGELTTNLKLRRSFVLEKYATELERLYQETEKPVLWREKI